MKILTAHKFYGRPGGPENLIYETERRLVKDGHKCIQFSMKASYNETNPYHRFFVTNEDYGQALTQSEIGYKFRVAAKLLYSLEAKTRLASLLAQEQIDIVHLHNIYHQISPSILPVLKKSGIPVVMTLHDLKLLCPNYRMYARDRVCEACKGHRYYNTFLKRCVKDSTGASLLNCIEAYVHYAIGVYEKNIDRFVCPSKFMKNKMAEYGFSEDRLILIRNGIDAARFRPIHENAGYVLYFGRLDKEKGVSTLARVASLLKHVDVVFTGTGNEEDNMRRDAEQKGITNIRFTGFLTGDELQKTIYGAMFTVAPSELYENCSLSVLESMAYGKPVIGSRIGGIPEQIDDGINGFLFEPGNADDLADKISYLASEPDLIVRMGKEARRTVEKNFSMDQHYEKLMGLYCELTKNA